MRSSSSRLILPGTTIAVGSDGAYAVKCHGPVLTNPLPLRIRHHPRGRVRLPVADSERSAVRFEERKRIRR